MAKVTAKTADKKKTKPKASVAKAVAAKAKSKAAPIKAAKPKAKPAPIKAAKPKVKPAPIKAAKPKVKPAPIKAAKPKAKPAPIKAAKPKVKPASKKAAKPAPKTAAKSAPATAIEAKSAPKLEKKLPSKSKVTRFPFSVNDYVVYPTHGVGKITGVEKQEISGMNLELFVVEFDKDKMVLRVPLAKAEGSGMRKLSSPQKMTTALTTLKGHARIKRTMWSRRAQEYEAKINSGDPVSIAEVIRDLHRSASQPEQSYSERQIYEAALERLARELAAVERIEEEIAAERLEGMLRDE